MRLHGNTILITGGGTGIGLALAEAFIVRRNQVVVCGRRRDILEKARRKVPELNIFPCDISREDDSRRLFEHVRMHFPGLNMLINNAAVMHRYRFTEGKDHFRDIEEEISINLTAPLKLCAGFLPILKGNPPAAVVNVTSAIARIVHEPSPVYCAAKAGLSMATKVLREQLKNESIRVFEVIPPPVDTSMCRGAAVKLSLEDLVRETIEGLERDRCEIRPGRTKLYYRLDGISPWLAKKAIGRI